ncbi:hypothetical protein ANN_02962 [Periplaneta americana]|uniref:Uncharacterized protein n=1 Tax=Periplaneta americana TaxID=6978 RepID=A0ABQ8TXQ4_PERAM|nr:hypothetical protein ANN_02962 [Periplaneta americana]
MKYLSEVLVKNNLTKVWSKFVFTQASTFHKVVLKIEGDQISAVEVMKELKINLCDKMAEKFLPHKKDAAEVCKAKPESGPRETNQGRNVGSIENWSKHHHGQFFYQLYFGRSHAVASCSKAFCLGLALQNARWFESSWGNKFSHEISASVWDRCPPSIVMHLESFDR